MIAARRDVYLRALGVERWILRQPETFANAEPEAASPTAEVREAPPAASQPEPGPAMAPVSMTESAPVATLDWDGLRAVVKDCMACKLCRTRTQTVFGVGPVTADLLVIGEGPGADEDAQGEPFVGRAGKLLDEMLKSIGRSRHQNTFIANVVKCRPPGNRDPDTEEALNCRPYLDRQIELLKPRLIVALGRIAAQRLLNTDTPLARLRGPLHRYGPEQTPLLITYHPAYLLRSPREKAKSWEDLKKIWRHLEGSRA